MVRRLLLHCKQLPRAFQIIRKKEISIREIDLFPSTTLR